MHYAHMPLWVSALYLLVLPCLCDVGPFMYFVTEPSFRTSYINITHVVEDRSLLDGGYIFLGPYSPKDEDVILGPQIFDMVGNLVWAGNVSSDNNVHNFRPCDYLGERQNHLCWIERVQVPETGEHRGSERIFNSSYMQTGRNYGAVDDMTYPNPHEFNVLDGGRSFIQTVYQRKRKDLTPYAGRPFGWIFDGCFQEINIKTGEPDFIWCASDHIPLWHTYVYLHIPENTVNYTEWPVGEGSLEAPWDNYHLNAVDKDENGDYLASLRHLNKVVKIAGKNNPDDIEPGKIVWNMGGKEADVKLGDNLHFSRQHHARVVSVNGTQRIISLFNNGFEDREGQLETNTSTAQTILIDERHKTALLQHEYSQPDDKMCIAQGSAQVLRNNNMFVGWGYCPSISEYSQNGTLLLHAHFTANDEVSYRAFKMPWVGHPLDPPKLQAYSLSCKVGPASPLLGYASWNGATEVRTWRFFVSTTSEKGPWIPAGTYAHDNFEVRVDLSPALEGIGSFAPFVAVEALDKDGIVLGSSTAETFVPIEQLAPDCTIWCCTPWFSFPKSLSRGGTCARSMKPSILALLITILGVESIMYLFGLSLGFKRCVSPSRQSYESIPTSAGAQQEANYRSARTNGMKPSSKGKWSGLESASREGVTEQLGASGVEV